MRNTSNNQQDFKSYRERRALSKNSHTPTTDTKSLMEIQQTLKQAGRLSLDHSKSLNQVCQSEDGSQGFRGRFSADLDNVEKDQPSISKIIQKYCNISAQITEVNEDDIGLSKIIQNPIKRGKAPIGNLVKNIAIPDKRLMQARPVQPKNSIKDISTMVTPRKSGQDPSHKIVSSFKTISKPAQKRETNKLEQNRVMKKLQRMEDEIMKCGFSKQSEVRHHLQQILWLLREG